MNLSGKELSQIVRSQVSKACGAFVGKYSRKPSLAVILVGDNPASMTYVSSKKAACEEIGFGHLDIHFDASITQQELLDCIEKLNADASIDGILVQMPLPRHIDENAITNAIDPSKDVDGFHPMNIGNLLLGESSLVACTPKGVLRILDHYNIPTDGKDVCIIGRSNIVGKPLAALLMQRDRNATVTVCNTHTKDLKAHTLNADILICAIGKPEFVTADMVKENAVVIDVGINRVDDSTKKKGFCLKGDVDFKNVEPKASAITPVPGGVGPMTIAMLMENTFIAACNHEGSDYKEFLNE